MYYSNPIIYQGIFLNAATANNFGACQTQCDNEANCLYFTFKVCP